MSHWTRAQGLDPQTAHRRFAEGKPPVSASRVSSRPVPVAPDAASARARGGLGLYAPVSSRDQYGDSGRQVTRLTNWAAQADLAVDEMEAERAGRGPGS